MVVRFLASIFDKEQVEARQSKQAYDVCLDLRRACLREFRQNARSEFSFTYPDAKILTATNCEDFLVYTQASGLTIFGQFADHVFPKLRYVSDAAPTDERISAIREFSHKIELYKDRPFLDTDKASQKAIGDDKGRSLISKGYCKNRVIENLGISSLTLYLDDQRIAEGVRWGGGAEPGHFARELYNSVVHQPRPAEAGVSIVRLEVGYAEEDGSGLACRVFYDSRRRFTGEVGSAEFSRTFGELGTLMSHMSREADWTEEKDEWDRKRWDTA